MKGGGRDTCSSGEVVLASNEASRDAHRALYHLSPELYIIVGDDILGSILGFTGDVRRIHITAHWRDIVRIAAWKTEPSKGDVFMLLRSSGVAAEELVPFRDSDTGDIFPWLYYGKRLDVLRRICRHAKANVERNISNREARVYCHLISEETKSIVASSL